MRTLNSQSAVQIPRHARVCSRRRSLGMTTYKCITFRPKAWLFLSEVGLEARILGSGTVSLRLFGPTGQREPPLEEDTKGSFFERPGNFSVPKVKFEIKTCWIVVQFLAHKPVNFTSWTDDFILVYTHTVILVI